MNRSFSKIRHIQEANRLLEKRVLSEQYQYTKRIGDQTIYVIDGKDFLFDKEQGRYVPYISPEEKLGWTEDKRTSYACVFNRRDKGNVGKQGQYVINNISYFPNGRYLDTRTQAMGNYQCNNDEIKLLPANKIQGQPLTSVSPATTAEVPGSASPSVETPQPEKDKIQPTGSNIIVALDQDSLTISGDPYQYKIGEDNEWYVKSYKKTKNRKLTNWVSLKGNQKASDYLDLVFKGKRQKTNPAYQATDQKDPDQR